MRFPCAANPPLMPPSARQKTAACKGGMGVTWTMPWDIPDAGVNSSIATHSAIPDVHDSRSKRATDTRCPQDGLVEPADRAAIRKLAINGDRWNRPDSEGPRPSRNCRIAHIQNLYLTGWTGDPVHLLYGILANAAPSAEHLNLPCGRHLVFPLKLRVYRRDKHPAHLYEGPRSPRSTRQSTARCPRTSERSRTWRICPPAAESRQERSG